MGRAAVVVAPTIRALRPAVDGLAAEDIVMRYTDILTVAEDAEKAVRQLPVPARK